MSTRDGLSVKIVLEDWSGEGWPVAAGDDNSILSRESIGGKTLDVPVTHGCGFGEENSKTEAWRAYNLQLLELQKECEYKKRRVMYRKTEKW